MKWGITEVCIVAKEETRGERDRVENKSRGQEICEVCPLPSLPPEV